MPGTLLNQLENVHDAFDANLFFWYFESRADPANAPTAIYLGGGPGYTSLDSMSGFPCIINPDANSSTPNPFSWNNNVNMLYVDQPAGTGYSYVTMQNGTYDVLSNTFTPLQDEDAMPETNTTTLAATLDPSPFETTLNTTAQAARVMWQFSQIFFQEFPETPTTKSQISIWGTSFGGIWATAFLSHFITQNDLVSSHCHPNPNATSLPLGTLGIGNGCIDFKIITQSYPSIAYNNTYGIQVFNESVYKAVMSNVTTPKTGCHDLIDNCRAHATAGDPTGQGNNKTVNAACLAASQMCWGSVQQAYSIYSNHSRFDLAQIWLADDVTDYFTAFYNQRWVQEDLGARVNFTSEDTTYELSMFNKTGDPMISSISALEHVVNSGLNVALVFGDRDYACNCGEAISLAASYPAAESFHAAGYTDIVINSSYHGGLVRQHGNVSFSRVFEAPHAVAAGQPETMARIFERAMFGRDVATGQVQVDDGYSTQGSPTAWCMNAVPSAVESLCFVYRATDSCTEEQLNALADGSAVVENFAVVKPKGIKLTGMTIVKGAQKWCKVRRVKCDETKPACRRCQTTGRKCDGYLEGNSNLSGRALAAAARKLPLIGPLSQALISSPSSRWSGDYMLFDFFRTQTAPASANFMPSQFWTRELMQLAQSEPAVWHAIVTLAALHRRWDVAETQIRSPNGLNSGSGPERDATALTRLAEGNYVRSISLARNMTSSAPALALSLALSTAANLMGRTGESRMHLMAGRRILAHDGKTAQTVRAAEILLRLDLDAMAFGEQTAPYEYDDTAPLRRLGFDDYGSISNYEDAAAALFSMMRTLMLVEEVPMVKEADLSKESFLRDMRGWEEGMARLETRKPPADENLLPSMSLRMYHALFRLYLLGDPDSWPQTRLDARLGIFTRMLTLAEGIARRQRMASATLTLEPGVIMVLWVVGAKCRHPRVRRRAHRLLKSLRRQEGLWRSDAIAALVTRVIDVEAGGGIGDASEQSYSLVSENEYAEAERGELEREMSLPWGVWYAPELKIPSYETWEDVSIPPEGRRVRAYSPTMSIARGCMSLKFYMSSEDVSQPGLVRDEVVWFHTA
ncbi:hypothetical protein G7Z17_g8535 [Cylindrodendrum hubeiense]|uniref:Zn(2)-C6 fungal-type domain-containing protein n=1 Tax=Cylindrodendrum hubeiense TaxID=595255 RepID=A0A9P5H695_9HYPO|nr:hypothetical protein G7Z17_g8535 [Cylindrodendrum hubeiense]